MIVFIIPLKSSKVSNSWERVCQLFERTLKSVCNQTINDFRVIVICNEKPQIKFEHPHVKYVEVDFPLPGAGHKAKDLDKGRKILTGLFHAKQWMPSHTMVVDADDCVSKHLAEFVSKNPDANGWFVNKGYVYQEPSKFIYVRKSAFNRWCGTCNIIKYQSDTLPKLITKELNKFYGNHRDVVQTMINQGKALEPLPFIGTVYVIGNKENIYQKGFDTLHNMNKSFLFKLKDSLNYRLLTKSIREEFSLYDIDNRLDKPSSQIMETIERSLVGS